MSHKFTTPVLLWEPEQRKFVPSFISLDSLKLYFIFVNFRVGRLITFIVSHRLDYIRKTFYSKAYFYKF